MTLPAGAEPPETITLKPAPFHKSVAVDGVFVPAEAIALEVAPEHWSSLKLVDILPHGTAVKKGDTLLTFDVEDLRDHIEDLERKQELAEVELERARIAAEQLRQTTPIDLEAARRHAEDTRADRHYMLTKGIPLAKETALAEVTYAEQSLFYAEEELRQLRKMYEADDLTEDTEEIILKRGQWAVDRAKFNLERQQNETRRTIEVNLPRDEVNWNVALQRAELALAKAEQDLAAALRQEELSLAQKIHERTESATKLKELKQDLALLSKVKAPAAGIFLHGDWTGTDGPESHAAFARKQAQGTSAAVTPEVVYGSIAPVGPLKLVAQVGEEHRIHLLPGDDGKFPLLADTPYHAVPTASPALAAAIAVESLNPVPDASGNAEAVFTFAPEAFADHTVPQPLPGSKAKAHLLDYQKPGALAVPTGYVTKRFHNGALRHYVLVQTDGKTSEREVTLGHRTEEKIEITMGVKPGEVLVRIP